MSSLTKNSILTFIALSTSLILGLAWNTLVSKLVGPDGLGTIAVVTLLSTALYTVGNLTFGTSTVYQLGNDKQKLGAIAANSLLMAVTVGILLFGLATLIIRLTGLYGDISQSHLYISLSIMVLNLIVYQMMSVLQGLGLATQYNFTYISRSASAIAIIGLALLLTGNQFLLLNKVTFVLLALLDSFVVTAIVALYLVREQVCFRLWKPDFALLKQTARIGLKMHTATIATFLYSQAGLLLASHYLSTTVIGNLYLASLFVQFVAFIPQAVQTMLYPKMAGIQNNDLLKLYAAVSRNTVFVVALAAGSMGIIGPVVLGLLFGTGFELAPKLLLLLLPGAVAASVSQIAASLWIRKKWLWQLTLSGVGMAVVGLLLQVWLIPRYGAIGSAIATSLTYILGMITILAVHITCVDTDRKGVKNIKSVSRILVIQTGDIMLYKGIWHWLLTRLRSYAA